MADTDLKARDTVLERIIAAVEAEHGPLDGTTPPLQSRVDVGALERLVEHTDSRHTNLGITFEWLDYTVSVTGDGTVTVE